MHIVTNTKYCCIFIFIYLVQQVNYKYNEYIIIGTSGHKRQCTSGHKRQGTSGHKHKNGVVPQKLYPRGKNYTPRDFHPGEIYNGNLQITSASVLRFWGTTFFWGTLKIDDKQ